MRSWLLGGFLQASDYLNGFENPLATTRNQALAGWAAGLAAGLEAASAF